MKKFFGQVAEMEDASVPAELATVARSFKSSKRFDSVLITGSTPALINFKKFKQGHSLWNRTKKE
jgi:hypothetical protein